MTARTSIMSPITNYSSTKYVPSTTSARRRSPGIGSTYSSSYSNHYASTASRPPAYPTSSRTSTYTSDLSASRYGTTRKPPTTLRTVTSPRPLPPGRGPLDEHGRKMGLNDIVTGRTAASTSSRISPVKTNYGTTTYTTTHSLGTSSRDPAGTTAPRSRFTRAGSVSDIRATFENMNVNSNHHSKTTAASSTSSSLGRSKRFGSHADLSSSSTSSTPRTSSINPDRTREDHLYDTGGVGRHVTKNYYSTNSQTYDYKGKENGIDSLPDIRRTVGQSSRSLTRSPSVDRGRREESPLVNGSNLSNHGTTRRSSLTTSRQNSINSISPQHSSIHRSSPETTSSVTSSSMASRGLVGLRNVGNTCFMNSILQCLSNTPLLLEYCLNEEYRDDINKTTSNMKGSLINAYAKLMKTLWKSGGDTYVSPNEFKSQIQKFAPRFVGYNQQDSQEFLIYLLEGLHEDVNRVLEKKKQIIKEEEGEERISASEKARDTWKRYLSRENSRIVDIFVGQLKSCLKCTTCGYASNTFDPLWQLSLPIKKRRISDVSLQDCLDLFTNEEILDGDEKPTCARCKQRRKCTKSFSIQKFPKVLIIHLKRFNHESLFRSKLSTNVDFPLNDLDLTKYAAEKGASPILYNLYAVSNHSGTPLSGHYTACAKHPYSGEWHLFNDQRVSGMQSSRVKSSEGYVLFYELSSQSARL